MIRMVRQMILVEPIEQSSALLHVVTSSEGDCAHARIVDAGPDAADKLEDMYTLRAYGLETNTYEARVGEARARSRDGWAGTRILYVPKGAYPVRDTDGKRYLVTSIEAVLGVVLS